MEQQNDQQKIVVLDKYDSAIDASIIKGVLETNGVPAGVMGDSTATALTMARVAVVVFERDLERARAILASEPTGEKD